VGSETEKKREEKEQVVRARERQDRGGEMRGPEEAGLELQSRGFTEEKGEPTVSGP